MHHNLQEKKIVYHEFNTEVKLFALRGLLITACKHIFK